MPIYEYQGQQYDISTEDPNEAKTKILSFLEKGKSPKKKTSIIDDASSKLFDTAQDLLVKTPSFLAGGVAGAISDITGSEDAGVVRDIYFDKVKELSDKRRERESNLDRGEGGKVVGALAQIPFYLTPMGAGAMIGSSGASTGEDLVREGASPEQALSGAGFDMASAAAMYALGPLTNVTGRLANAGVQAGINVAQEAGINRPMQNVIRENADLPRLPEMGWGDYAAAAVPGAVFGAISPKKGKPGETPLPDETPKIDPDKIWVTRQEAKLRTVEAQTLVLSKQIDSIRPRSDGTYSEAQFKMIQDLEAKKADKEAEASSIKKNIAAYNEPSVAEKVDALSVEDILGKEDLAEIDFNEKVRKFSSDSGSEIGGVSHLKGIIEELQAVYIMYGPEAGEALLLDRASRAPESSGFSDEIRTKGFLDELNTELSRRAIDFHRKVGSNTTATTSKQRGSWTPFESSEEPRPDESNAPGIHEPQPRKGKLGFTKFIREKIDPDFDDPRHKQPPPPIDEGLTLSEWAVKDDGIDPFGKPPEDSRELAIYNQKRVELERAGIIETPIGNPTTTGRNPTHRIVGTEISYIKNPDDSLSPVETPVLSPEGRYKGREFRSSEKANNFVKRLEGQVESMKKRYDKLREAFDSGTTIWNSETRTTMPVTEDVLTKAESDYIDARNRLGRYRSKDMGWREDKVSKPQITETFSLDDDANKTVEQVKQDRIDAGLDPLPQPPRGPGFKQRGSIDLFASNEKGKSEDVRQVARRLKNPEFDRFVDVTNFRSPEEMWAEMKEPWVKDWGGVLNKAERAMFGFQQFAEAVKRKAPLVWEQAKLIRRAENQEVEAKRLIWHGKNSDSSWKFGPVRKMKHVTDPDSMETLLPSLSDNDKIVLTEFLTKNSNERVRHTKADMSGLTDLQKKAVKIIQDFYDSVHSIGGTKYRNGYVHAVRQGDFAVGITTSKGDMVHVEPAPTKQIAEKMKAYLEKQGYNTTDIIDFKQEEGNPIGDSYSTVKDTLESLRDRLPDVDAGEALRAMDAAQQFMADNSTPGKHNLRASLYSGYKGTSLFKGRKQNAEDFFNSFKNYLDEVAAQTKKNQLGADTARFWENDFGRKLKENFPNQYDTAMYLNDVAMNKNQDFYFKNSKGDEVPIIKSFDDKARKVIDDFVSRQVVAIGENLYNKGLVKDFNPFYYPEVPILDRSIGLAAQLFYIRTLTSRPAFWAGQFLSSPFAARQFLKEGTVLDTLVAQGKAWGTIMTGGDKEFSNFYNDIKQGRDTIRPQFIVDINRVPIVEDKEHPTLNKVFMWGTGQEQAGIADAASRYFTLAMAYHFYKDMGLSGTKLKENAIALTENTMQMYNRANSPPILNKLGIVGQNIAPLQKYGLGQLENLIGDIRYMMDQPGTAGKLRGALPALSTLMVTMIMGGTTGISLLTEYEMVRYLTVFLADKLLGKDLSKAWPSAIENMMKHQNWLQQGVQATYEGLGTSKQFAKDASTHGIPSAMTGHDIGSSLRFNPYVGESVLKQSWSPIENFPIVKQAIDLAGVGFTKVRKHTGGNVDEAEERKADLSLQLLVGQNYLVDKLKYNSDNRPFVPGGGRSYGQVVQTPEEQIGQLIGSPTLSTAKDRKVVELMDRDQKKLAQKRQDAIDLITDGYLAGDKEKTNKAIELALGAEMTKEQIMRGVKASIVQRNKTRLDAMTTNRHGIPHSTEQKRKYIERLQYE